MALTKAAIWKAILYADIFNFPLTKEELSLFAGDKISSATEFEETLESLKASFTMKDGFYLLKGREKLVQLRMRRKQSSEKKLDLARILSVYMSFIPSVQFVGVTGGVAAGNAEKEDDIDFIIITSAGSLWTTRLTLLTILHLLGRRRVRNARVVSDMACLNLFLDASVLSLPKKMRSIYTAHEMVQMNPLFSRGGTYEAFLEENDWIYTYLPQAKKRIEGYRYTKKAFTTSVAYRLFSKNIMVQLSKFLQRFYMGKKSSESYISDTMIGFYPQSFHAQILKLYKEKLKQFQLNR